MFNKVFISYAKEDFEVADQLYNTLLGHNYDPWLDKHCLLPGQDWSNEIRLSLRKADYIVLLLSKTSVAKRGFVQREFKLALEYCEEKLETDIYIIPFKIDECEVPEKLAKYQWSELKQDMHFMAVIQALNIQRARYYNDYIKNIEAKKSYEFTEQCINRIITNEYVKNSHVSIVYPQFTDTSNDNLLIINSYVANIALSAYGGALNYENLIFPNDVAEVIKSSESSLSDELRETSILDFSYKIELLTKDFISITIFEYAYSGGAHGLYATSGHNFKLNPYVHITLETLLDYDNSCLGTLSAICKERLLAKGRILSSNPNLQEEEFFISERPLEPKWETFDNFYINKQGLNILFPIYQETAFAWGEHVVLIQYDELMALHPSLDTFKKVSLIVNN